MKILVAMFRQKYLDAMTLGFEMDEYHWLWLVHPGGLDFNKIN